MVQVTVSFHTDEFIFVWSMETETGSKTPPRVPKLGYFEGLGVFCHMHIHMINQKIMSLIFKSENPL